jgi:ABC-type multidrug transport system fused ATPase/permease subunit
MALVQTFLIGIYVFPWFLVILPVVCGVSLMIVSNSILSIKETVKVYSTTKSPILSYLGETIQGSSTIRAFGREEDFKRGFCKLSNASILAIQMQAGVSGWFSIRVDALAMLLILIISVICVMFRDVDAVIMSMLLSNLLIIQYNLTWTLKSYMALQSTMVNASRCMKLTQVP